MKTEERLRKYLEDHGITKLFVAKRAGINEKRIYRILDGTSPMRAEEFKNICIKALNVDPMIFFVDKNLDSKDETSAAQPPAPKEVTS
ncbi:helix-turn-helix domain-containing protein [Alicyclobacillus sp. ALC3]|uniref:helix-turn-helix domain-containing protein n=1 Tax=Alicyclobacillus sp. ALC3 TaxID=2796143 RepID=UPI00237871B6|nr:helix-turn-helix transcriptional regulator [Alicyclobacillus sp. ALC3]WDL97842.1 helix-turn-helix transcriptional regulator [Alicyclobacillus sp. ALC3]